MANIMYVLSCISIVFSILIAFAFLASISSLINTTFEKIVVISLAVIIIEMLMASLSRFLFILGRSYMVESIRNSDRIHAINFGKFFLNLYGKEATPDDVKEVFGQWNIDNGGTSFRTQTSDDIDPKFDKLVEKFSLGK